MCHSLSKADIDRRSEQFIPVSRAAELAALAKRRFQIEASHLKQTQKRKSD